MHNIFLLSAKRSYIISFQTKSAPSECPPLPRTYCNIRTLPLYVPLHEIPVPADPYCETGTPSAQSAYGISGRLHSDDARPRSTHTAPYPNRADPPCIPSPFPQTPVRSGKPSIPRTSILRPGAQSPDKCPPHSSVPAPRTRPGKPVPAVWSV